jgi:two-component system response regulator FixJ
MLSPLRNPNLATVYVVDDDADTLKLIQRSLMRLDVKVQTYLEARQLLDEPVSSDVGALLLDVRLTDTDGLQLMRQLRELGWRQPVVMITAHAEVPLAVQAMKEGAFDFVEKEFCDDSLQQTIERAIAKDREVRKGRELQKQIAKRQETLTPRERQVAEKLVAGEHTKGIAVDLAISAKTVEYHRSNVLNKMESDGIVELTRLWLQAD